MDNIKTANSQNIKLTISFIAVLLGTILMTITIFLPYATAIDNHAENLRNHPDTTMYKEIGMTAKDMIHISMFEYARVYCNLSEQIFGSSSLGILYAVFVALIGGFSLLAVLFSILKKPIPIIIFDILAFIVFRIQSWDYTDRGVIPSTSYDWGIGYYLFYVAAIIAFVGAIWLLVNKIIIRKNRKTIDNAP